MKKIFAYVLLILSLGVFFSCQEKPQQEQDDDFVLVGVSVSYENVGLVKEEPLTRAVEPNALYGIQVHEFADENDIWNSVRYCYGLYDDISQLKIQFKRNRKYFIRMDYFPNGKNDLPYQNNGYSPLQVMPWHEAQVPPLNTIVYSSSTSLDYIGSSMQQSFERYMYWNEAFVPTDNTPIPVHFLRMNAGLTFVFERIEGFDFEEVQVTEKNWSNTYKAQVSNDTRIVIDRITLGNSGWGEGLPEVYLYNFEIGTPDNPSLFFSGELEVKRNTMRTYSVKMESDVTINPMTISYDKNTYAEDNGGFVN